jgi:hypothetical protein
VVRKAEEEIKYLQASGKVTKAPSNTSLGGARRKTTTKSGATPSRQQGSGESPSPRLEEQGAVGGISPSLNHFLQVCVCLSFRENNHDVCCFFFFSSQESP